MEKNITVLVSLSIGLFIGGVGVAAESSERRATKQAGVSTLTAEDLPGNFGTVSDGIYRGAEPVGDRQFAGLVKLGVKTMVSLRYFHGMEKEMCAKYGITCYERGIFVGVIGTDTLFPWTKMAEAYQLVISERAAGRKVFFHCMKGRDRTGTLAALIMMRDRACSGSYDKEKLWTEVNASMEKYGFNDKHFIFLKRDIKNIAFNFEANRDWICDGKPYHK
ncbi:MAG: tyrosine-protein phosphatase [Elusimicrobiaceae bacterium]